MNGRKIKIEVEELNGDGSEFELVCVIDELIVERSEVSYCFEDVVDLFGDFFRMVSDKYNFDFMNDKIEIGLDWKY
jgi:hypothetical protein